MKKEYAFAYSFLCGEKKFLFLEAERFNVFWQKEY